ncbi:hypothetical protein [Nitratireductor pacificus]|uniref:hypothetical protein n=1 Tax=Nitratireductor pacificus TaxID=1231180 RepID=UPI0002FEB8CA|nr:hypothetical protein [Nitratireductor pacificus]
MSDAAAATDVPQRHPLELHLPPISGGCGGSSAQAVEFKPLSWMKPIANRVEK